MNVKTRKKNPQLLLTLPITRPFVRPTPPHLRKHRLGLRYPPNSQQQTRTEVRPLSPQPSRGGPGARGQGREGPFAAAPLRCPSPPGAGRGGEGGP